jgi:hypothetical protein
MTVATVVEWWQVLCAEGMGVLLGCLQRPRCVGTCAAASRSLCAFLHPSTQACAWTHAQFRCKDSSIVIRYCVMQGMLQDKPAILLVGGGEGMGKLKATVEQLDLKLQGSAQVSTKCWGVVSKKGRRRTHVTLQDLLCEDLCWVVLASLPRYGCALCPAPALPMVPGTLWACRVQPSAVCCPDDPSCFQVQHIHNWRG